MRDNLRQHLVFYESLAGRHNGARELEVQPHGGRELLKVGIDGVDYRLDEARSFLPVDPARVIHPWGE